MITIDDIEKLPESEAKEIAMQLWNQMQSKARYMMNEAYRIFDLAGKPECSPYNLDKLSNQEKRVLMFIAQGMTIDKIASTMDKSYSTILTYRSRIKQKMGFTTVPELQKFAFEALDELEHREID